MADPAPKEPNFEVKVPQSMQRAAELIEDLLRDKDIGAQVRAKAKAKYDDVTFPEDAVEPAVSAVREEMAALQKRLDEEREERAAERTAAEEKRQEQTLQQALDSARTKFNLTDEGLQATVDRMKETGNYADPLAAAAYVVSQEPKPAQSSSAYLGPQHLNFAGSAEVADNDRIRLLHADPQGKFLDAEFRDFVADPDKYVRDAFAA